jgi:hypothetical protein
LSRRITAIVAFALLFALALPATAITKGGAPDDGEHPYVGLMVAYEEPFDHDDDENTPDIYRPLWRCSGSLISATVYVTAGHCVGEDPGSGNTPVKVALWFDEHEAEIRGSGYPFYEGAANTGTPHPHPSYVPTAFYLFDLGVVVLDEPVEMDTYASIPDSPGVVDDIEHGRNKAAVEAVGYGLQNANKNHTVANLERMKADLFVVNREGVAGLKRIFDFVPGSGSFLVSGDAAHGGTCFGDSGGPMLLGDSDLIVGVNSFGLNANCAGVGGAYAIDQPDDLDFINSFLS